MSTELLYDVAPAGSCKHRPISNGWGQGWRPAEGHTAAITWCGYCRSTVEIDDEWAEKFRAAGKPVPEPKGSP